MKENTNSDQKKKRLKKILIPVGVAAAAVGGFFGWRWWNAQKQGSVSQEFSADNFPVTTAPVISPIAPSSYSSGASTRKDEFPIKKGSKGERVKILQEALISKYGPGILPRYGADGDFGPEMQNALQSKNLPTVIDENTFKILTAGIAVDLNTIAKSLFKSLTAKNFSDTLSSVKKIQSQKDYKWLNERFQVIVPSAKKSLARFILESFPTASRQDPLRIEFLRLGLKFDGYEWSLSGLRANPTLLITTTPTQLIDFKHKLKITVPAKMIIGYYLQSKNGYTLFKTIEKNKKLIVKSQDVKTYERN